MNVIVLLINTYVRAKEKEIKSELIEATKMKKLDEKGFEDDSEFRSILEQLKECRKKHGDLFTEPESKQHDEDDEGEFEDVDDDDYDPADEMILTAGDLELYDSPLEKVDAPIYFKNVMEEIQANIPDLYESLVSMLTKDQIQQLENNFSKNEELLKLEKSSEETQ
mmetsp:Transcript_35269/g.40726  ORF Transcript_35269/g.40726 Transcript_35269/m.40726 type:complete len:166 (-) Transcript_35269:55-552(-)